MNTFQRIKFKKIEKNENCFAKKKCQGQKILIKTAPLKKLNILFGWQKEMKAKCDIPPHNKWCSTLNMLDPGRCSQKLVWFHILVHLFEHPWYITLSMKLHVLHACMLSFSWVVFDKNKENIISCNTLCIVHVMGQVSYQNHNGLRIFWNTMGQF